MAVPPSYDELLVHYKVDRRPSIMEETFCADHVISFASEIDIWEMLAKSLRITNPDIESIRNKGGAELQRLKLLECWKHRCGSKATYKVLAEALLQVKRTDLAEKVVALALQVEEQATTEGNQLTMAASTNQASPSFKSDSGSANLTTVTFESPGNPQTEEVMSNLRQLENDFYKLVKFTEDTLKDNGVNLDEITRRFSMLPQSIKWRHETDEDYKVTRQKILDSGTIKKLFDNLTALRHWSFMMPDTLAHIIQDINICSVHEKIDEYMKKLSSFKAKTKLKELIGLSFAVPDYCIELSMTVEGWEDITINDAEKSQ